MPAKIGQWKGPKPPEKTYVEFSLQGWRKNPNKVAVVDVNSGKEITFARLEDEVQKFAGSLQRLGVSSQTKVQFYADNTLKSLIALQAALFCNASVFAFKPSKATKYAEYKFQTEDAEVEYVITDGVNYDIAVHLLLADPECCVKKVIIITGTPTKSVPADKVLFADLLPKGNYVEPKNIGLREDKLIVTYTSGSTGMPKGVIHSHYTFVAAIHTMGPESMSCYIESDRFLLLSNLAYVTGTVFCSGTLACGASVLLASHDIDVDLPLFVEMYKATVFVMLECPMKTVLSNMHRFVNIKKMLSSIRLLLLGGPVFQENLRKETTKLFSGKLFMHIFGMTEAFGLITAAQPSTEFTDHIGFAAPNLEVKVVKDNGECVEIGEAGELLWRGPQMTLGYWKRESNDFTSDGFYATGDMATVDSQGCLSIIGRKKHFIICLEERIAPTEIEDALLKHPAVSEVVVVPTPHSVVKEAPTALVILKPPYGDVQTQDNVRQELIDFIATQFNEHKQLHGGVYFVDSLDKTETGKYSREVLMQKALKLSGIKSSSQI